MDKVAHSSSLADTLQQKVSALEDGVFVPVSAVFSRSYLMVLCPRNQVIFLLHAYRYSHSVGFNSEGTPKRLARFGQE